MSLILDRSIHYACGLGVDAVDTRWWSVIVYSLQLYLYNLHYNQFNLEITKFKQETNLVKIYRSLTCTESGANDRVVKEPVLGSIPGRVNLEA